jgi:NhaP-type Na+/H+ and K+/H+ antiporter
LLVLIRVLIIVGVLPSKVSGCTGALVLFRLLGIGILAGSEGLGGALGYAPGRGTAQIVNRTGLNHGVSTPSSAWRS